ncbi:hypothetical protein [Paenibacillus sp. FSL L8-0506]|uniref:hypothetical protein n=1 Tax=Paenibacillus sp. FSL L8-0506 TaxID=2975335 RepID=UPI0030F88275
MGKSINSVMIDTSYAYAQDFFLDNIDRKLALQKICDLSLMNRGSASAYMRNFSCMMLGINYKRTMNLAATQRYLRNIYEDFGIVFFINAMRAVRLHMQYYESTRGIYLKSMNELVNKLEDEILNFDKDSIFYRMRADFDSLKEGIIVFDYYDFISDSEFQTVITITGEIIELVPTVLLEEAKSHWEVTSDVEFFARVGDTVACFYYSLDNSYIMVYNKYGEMHEISEFEIDYIR